MKKLDLVLDVTESAGLGEPAHIAATVCLPDADKKAHPSIICFAKPGAGFSRHYFTTDLPGPASGDQASWHTENGWIFVAIDPLGVGDSSQHDSSRLDFDVVTRSNLAVENKIIDQLQRGKLSPEFPPVTDIVQLGIGQSMGGCLTVIQQAKHHCYDGIAILGFSAVHTQPKVPPGQPQIISAWNFPSSDLSSSDGKIQRYMQNEEEFRQAYVEFHGKQPGPMALIANRSNDTERWFYYFDDIIEYLPERETDPVWISKTLPGLVVFILSPGIIAAEAAAVKCPVFIGVGERDAVTDMGLESSAYQSARSVDSLVCPRMAHMHNFAGTREQLWQGIQTWGNEVARGA